MKKRTHSLLAGLILLALLAVAGHFVYRWRYAIADGFEVFLARLGRLFGCRSGGIEDDDYADL